MDKVRQRIREYIKSGIVKTEGIKKLKREFKLEQDKLSVMWLEEKENISPKHPQTSKKVIENKKVKDDLEVLEEEVIKHIKVKGRNGIYEAKTGLGVALENGEYKLAFCNIEELTEFYNEYKKVFERI